MLFPRQHAENIVQNCTQKKYRGYNSDNVKQVPADWKKKALGGLICLFSLKKGPVWGINSPQAVQLLTKFYFKIVGDLVFPVY